MTPLQKTFVANPDSAAIAAQLTQAKRTACKHERNPCILRCGVEAPTTDPCSGGTLLGPWTVIPKAHRDRWLKSFEDERLNGWCWDHDQFRYQCGCLNDG
jgi:hypothetical protein